MMKSKIFISLLILLTACFKFQNKKSVSQLEQSKHSNEKWQSGLVVLLIVDQMRPDYLERYQNVFKGKGLARFKDQGVWFQNAYTAGAPTVTAAGHASICTGSTPSEHGIIGNLLLDKATGVLSESASDSGSELVRTQFGDGFGLLERSVNQGSSPHQMRMPTLANHIERMGGVSAAVSLKDRGAVLCAGGPHAYWFDYQTASMVSSRFFFKDTNLPRWVDAFNLQVRPSFEEWKAFYSPKEWFKNLVPQDGSIHWNSNEAEKLPANPFKQKGFPYSIATETLMESALRFKYTPAASRYLADFALQSVKALNLGRNSRTDFLSVSFSTPDLVGHGWGSHSHELAEIYLQLNNTIEDLMNAIKKQAPENVTFVLTADHGVQRTQSQKRIMPQEFKKQLSDELMRKHALVEDPLLAFASEQIYFKENLTLKREEIIKSAQNIVRSMDGVHDVLTQEEISTGKTWIHQRLKRGLHPERSGDLIVVFQEGWLGDGTIAGNHGSVWNEDSRIPLAFLSSKMKQAKYEQDAYAHDIAPTILEMIALPLPEAMNGSSLYSLLISASSD